MSVKHSALTQALLASADCVPLIAMEANAHLQERAELGRIDTKPVAPTILAPWITGRRHAMLDNSAASDKIHEVSAERESN